MEGMTKIAFMLIAVSFCFSSPLHERIRRELLAQPTCSEADVVFVLDSSGSIGETNWQKVLNFTKDIISNFTNIGPRHTQVGILTYATKISNRIFLNEFSSHEALYDQIDLLPWKDEETNTSGALWYLHERMFAQANGARSRAPRIAILVTDGKSNRDQNLTIPYATDVHNAGITVMSVGIGDDRDPTELNAIASNASYVYEVDNFDGLKDINSQISEAACDIPVECNRDGDITFILDSSGSVSIRNFELMKQNVIDLVELINVDGNTSNVGMITFGTQAKLEFYLDQYNYRFDIQEAIRAVQYTRGTTNTAEALRMLRDQMYQPERGDRPGIPNIALLFTDGGSNNFEDTLEAAKQARIAGITLVVITVTDWINMNEVREMASDPDEFNVFQTTFDNIASIRNDLKSILCDQWNECQGTPCLNGGTCYNGVNKYECTCPPGTAGINCQHTCSPVDVVVSIDSSGSIGENNYYKILSFIKDFAENMNFGEDEARMGLSTFADNSSIEFHLNEYSTKDQVSNAISFKYTGGTTNTARALMTMNDVMFTSQHGSRTYSRSVGIIVTDGESNDRDMTFEQAARAREAGISLISVAINMRTTKGRLEVKGIASDPDDRNVLFVDNFNSLSNFTDQLVMSVCNSMNECESDPCQGGGVCFDEMNGYRCICPDGRSGTHCERECDGRADIVFIVDTSGSIREERFRLVRDFIISIVSQMEIGQDKVRVGLVTFSDEANDEFHLNEYEFSSDVIHAIEMMPYARGRTATAAALRMTYTTMFTPENGDRENVPSYGVIITDGESTVEPEMTLPEAIQARIRGIHLIAVTVGNSANNLEIRGIASDPDEFNVYNVERFQELEAQAMPLVNGMCDTVDECASNPCGAGGDCINGLGQYVCLCDSRSTGMNCERQCTRRGDVVFVLDSSGSIEGNFEIAQNLARRIVHGLNFEGGRTRVGVVEYSSAARVRFYLREYSSKQEVLNAMTFTVDGQRTNTFSGVQMMREEMFTSANGDRNGDPNWSIVITDGRSNMNVMELREEARRAHEEGITMFAVGIGENGRVDRNEINSIASDPDSDFAYIMQSPEELDEIADNILDLMCQ